MKVYNVISKLKIESNTSIVIDDKGKDMHNGICILDENGNPYIVLSVGMSNTKGEIKTTTLLIEGDFNSNKIFI